MDAQHARQRFAWLERGGVALLLVAALAVRARDVAGPFDREFDGAQGAFFAIAAVNYERFGPLAFRGYPTLVLDAETHLPAEALVYGHHPPSAPLLAWASAKLLGPDGWQAACAEHRAPRGLELPLRLPFLVLHLFGLWAFWWALRAGLGPGTAMLALGFYAALPVAVFYGSLVNYENPALPFVFLGFGAYARYLRAGGARRLLGLGVSFAAGCLVTFGPAFFLPPLVLHALLARRPRAAAAVAAVGGAGVGVALLAHGLATPGGGGSLWARARVLWAPLLDGSYPLSGWIANQVHYLHEAAGLALLVAAAAGLATLLARHLSPALERRLAALEVTATAPRVDLVSPLALGALLYLLAFYRHTFEPQRPFLLFAAPGIAGGAAVFVAQLARPLLRLRAGLAPVVLVALALVLPGLGDLARWRDAARAPGPRDEPPGRAGPDLPLPPQTGAALAALLPPGGVGLVPDALGLNLAHSWYAWRAVFGVPEPASGHPFLALVPASPVRVLLPDEPPAAAAGAVAAWRAALGEPAQRAAGWSAWEFAR